MGGDIGIGDPSELDFTAWKSPAQRRQMLIGRTGGGPRMTALSA
jgi:hypothetical protein